MLIDRKIKIYKFVKFALKVNTLKVLISIRVENSH